MVERAQGDEAQSRPGLTRPLVSLLAAITTILQIVVPLARLEITYRVIDDPNAATLAGLLSAAFALLPVLLLRRIGVFGDVHGERPMLMIGGLLTGLAVALLLIRSGQWPELLAASAVLGLGQMVLLSALQLAIVRCAPAEAQDRLLGYHLVAISIGMALAPLLLSWATPTGAAGPGTSLQPLLVGGALLLVAASGLLAWRLPKPARISGVVEVPYAHANRLQRRVPCSQR